MSGTMPRWTQISYREFYDVPRAIVVSDGQHTYFFDCPFDQQRDDYASDYDVYIMPSLSPSEMSGSWVSFPQRAVRRLGRVAVGSVRFDETRRREIDLEILEQIHETV
jgi:hypothetical protein